MNLLGRLLIRVLGEEVVDNRLLRLRASTQERLGRDLLKDRYVSWAAEMVQRYSKDEPDILRRLALQDLALAMITYEEKINPPGNTELQQAKERLGAQLGMLGHIIKKHMN